MELIPLVGAATGIGSMFMGGQKQQSTQTPVDMTRPEFRALAETTTGALGGAIGGGPTGLRPYSGPLTAPLGGNEATALGATQASALNPLRSNLINATLGGQFLPGGANQNPFLNAMITQAQVPTAEALQHAIGRQIPSAFAGAGQQPGGNSAMELALARQGQIGARALSDIATGIGSQAYLGERGFQNAAIGLNQQDIQAMIANIQAQGLPRMLAQNDITTSINLGQQGIGNWLQSLQLAGQLPLQTIANQGQATGSAPANMLPGLFGNQGLFGWLRPPQTGMGGAGGVLP